jgi:hypothetical protein
MQWNSSILLIVYSIIHPASTTRTTSESSFPPLVNHHHCQRVTMTRWCVVLILSASRRSPRPPTSLDDSLLCHSCPPRPSFQVANAHHQIHRSTTTIMNGTGAREGRGRRREGCRAQVVAVGAWDVLCLSPGMFSFLCIVYSLKLLFIE